MKRKGRQHGMVRTLSILPNPLNPRPETRHVNRFDFPATAGTFTRVSNKPTNHSKFTGKCGRPRCSGCHLGPACKAKDKTKGTQKTNKSTTAHMVEMSLAVNTRPGPGIAWPSATMVLNRLVTGDCRLEYYDGLLECDEYPYGEEDYLTVDHDQTRIGDYDDDHREEEMSFVEVEEDDNWLLV